MMKKKNREIKKEKKKEKWERKREKITCEGHEEREDEDSNYRTCSHYTCICNHTCNTQHYSCLNTENKKEGQQLLLLLKMEISFFLFANEVTYHQHHCREDGEEDGE